MSHKIKVERIPHINKDGSESASKRDYRVVDRTRAGRVVVGVTTSKKACDELVYEHRVLVHNRHSSAHPNDRAFTKKHSEKKEKR